MKGKQLANALEGLQERIDKIAERVETRRRVTLEIEKERNKKYFDIYVKRKK